MKAGWTEKPISQCFKVRSGDFLPAKAMATDGNIDVYGGNGITGMMYPGCNRHSFLIKNERRRSYE